MLCVKCSPRSDNIGPWYANMNTSVPYQQFVIFDDTEKLGPLAKAFLAQQECTDAGVLHQIHGRFLRRPLVTHLLALPILLFLIVRLVGAAHGVRVIVWEGDAEHAGVTFICCSLQNMKTLRVSPQQHVNAPRHSLEVMYSGAFPGLKGTASS